MNKVILIGNLAKDPEMRTTGSGTAVATFDIAVNRQRKDANGNRAVDYFPIVVWRQLAELCSKYLAKGRKVAVVGELQTRSYESKDGTKRHVTEIVANEIEFLTPKGESKEQANFAEGFTEIDGADLPF